jgi:4-amino-4-deoxy-L-arabinose transferase-like glycosyltransferase
MSPRSVVIIAVLLRVGWVLAVPTRPVGDFAMYLESASHLLHMRALDPEFVFMPGYVAFVAGVLALGGGVLAIKLCVALAAGLAAGAVCGVAGALWDRRAGVAAGLAYALWPAGIAVTSVTGTDMPAAILVVTAVFCLVRWGGTRPILAAVLFGVVMGLAAWVRAVAMPLAAFSFFYFFATARAGGTRGQRFMRAAGLAAVATAVAVVVLLPWGVRNHRRYGEWFITDSHGGLTALVGANPNTDGRYSRSLNRMFKDLTGYTLLEEPHRAADRASYQLARDWTQFSPAYAAGLVVQKAERLLREQHPLLYWPIYREGVLPAGRIKAWFERWRAPIETVVDGYWVGLVVLFFAGTGLAIARRRFDALWFMPMGMALIGIYALFFAEARYQLPIVVLMFPVAGGAMSFLADVSGHLRRSHGFARGPRRELLFAGGAVAVAGGALVACSFIGHQLRETNRFAVHVCQVAGANVACKWRHNGEGISPVRGIWNGVGMRLAARTSGDVLAARAAIALPPGTYRLAAEWDVAPVGDVAPLDAFGEAPDAISVTLRANDTAIGATDLATLLAASRRQVALPLSGAFVHAGGPLLLRLEVRGRPRRSGDDDGGSNQADAAIAGETPADPSDVSTRKVGLSPASSLWLSKLTITPAHGTTAHAPATP